MSNNESYTLASPATGDEILYLEVIADTACHIDQVTINGSTTRLFLDFGTFTSATSWDGRLYRLQPGDQYLNVAVDAPAATWFVGLHVITGDAMIPDDYTVADNSGAVDVPITTLGGWNIVTAGLIVATASVATYDPSVLDVPAGWVLESSDLAGSISVAHAYLPALASGVMLPQYWGSDALDAWQVTTVPFYNTALDFRTAGPSASSGIFQPAPSPPEQSVDFAGQSINVIPPPDPTPIVVPTPPYTHTPTRRVD